MEAESQEHLLHIQSLTEPDLVRLDIDDMLVELLDRVRIILGADTAAILLLDEGSSELVARAARGIEEEVYQGVRIPLRRGFAGRIAAERRPVVLDRVDSTTVANPILWEKGIKAMLGVPLVVGDHLIGVLHVGTLGERRFTEQDAELLEVVAERVGLATQTRLLETERAAAKLLERSLLPASLPAVEGLEMAARYVTAEDRDVGGDWYDAFTLPSGSVWITAGDVFGHGLRYAVVMGRIRTAIRAYALEVPDATPHEVLTLIDQNLQHFDPGELATAVCVTSAPPFDHLRIASAGHPPAILSAPGEDAAPIDIGTEPALGVLPGVERSSTVVPFPPGSVLLLYTDGLVERRGEALDVGISRLCRAASSNSPDVVCASVMMRLVGETQPRDDIAVIAVRRIGAGTAR
jgi:putative methionine-R-sulfoxide reductase with GAF domain